MTILSIPLPGAQPVEDPLDSPELLMLNALLHTKWNPGEHKIHLDMIRSFKKAWVWMEDHHQTTGQLPTVELFHRTFPTIEILEGVNPVWAANKVRDAHFEWELRRGLQEAMAHLNQGEAETARSTLLGISRPIGMKSVAGMDPLDDASVDDQAIRAGWPVPFPALQRVTNGFGKGEFIVLGARLGQGKSLMAVEYAKAAAEANADVTVLTLEMTSRAWSGRLQTSLAAGMADAQDALRSPDATVRKTALRSLPKPPGSIKIFDPTHLQMNLRTVEEAASESQFLVIDHVGLLKDSQGRRAIDDWRIMATISNTIKEIGLATGCTILGLCQINREGDKGWKPPAADQLAQSDALGQDADIVITQRQAGTALVHGIPKNRWGTNVMFFTSFEPGAANYQEITKEEFFVRKEAADNGA